MTELDRDGRLPLHHAALANDAAEAERRLAAGDDPTCGDRLGLTPLHLAAQSGAVAVAQTLLDHGAAVDQQDTYGNTALWTAVFNSRGRGEMIWLLRRWGADAYHSNSSGKSPLSLARIIDNYDVAQFFSDLPT